MRFPVSVSLLLVLPLSACAAGTSGGAYSGDSRNLLTSEELAVVRNRDLLTALEQLRPRWLRARGPVSLEPVREEPAVQLEGAWGTLADLRAIEVVEVREVRFMPPGEATTRYGTGYVHGIIRVTLRGSRTPR